MKQHQLQFQIVLFVTNTNVACAKNNLASRKQNYHWFTVVFISLFSPLVLPPTQSSHNSSMFQMPHVASLLLTDV